jgi:hypothetical protein
MGDNSPAALAQLAATQDAALVTMGFGNLKSFEFTYRTATMFSQSTMVPVDYQAQTLKGYGQNANWVQNPAAISNCMIALDMAHRMNMHPLLVMQNLHVIEGRPSWSSPFIIAVINSCGEFSKLRFDLQWFDGEVDVEYTVYEWQRPVGGDRERTAVKKTARIRNAKCIAWAIEKETGERVESAPITLEMAVKEGWYTKNGSKWPTMPETMLRYRSAANFGKVYVPELLMGLPSVEETKDVIDVERQPDGTYAVPPAASAPAPEAEPVMPRPPRARAAAPAAEPAAPAAAAPEPAPAAAAAPEAAAPTPAVIEVATAEAVTGEDPPSDLFAGMDGSAEPAQAEQPAAEAPAPEKVTTPAVTPEPAVTEAAVDKKKSKRNPLSTAKIKFVNDQLAKGENGLTLARFEAAYGIKPEGLSDVQFKNVLAWLKDPSIEAEK